MINKDLALLTSGGLSKLVATVITYPLVTIKVNQQTDKSKTNVLAMIYSILSNYGPGGFYKGILF